MTFIDKNAGTPESIAALIALVEEGLRTDYGFNPDAAQAARVRLHAIVGNPTDNRLTYDELDAIIAADGRGWLESDGVIAIFNALKAKGLCKGDAPSIPDLYTGHGKKTKP